jgi:hypothetical protein
MTDLLILNQEEEIMSEVLARQRVKIYTTSIREPPLSITSTDGIEGLHTRLTTTRQTNNVILTNQVKQGQPIAIDAKLALMAEIELGFGEEVLERCNFCLALSLVICIADSLRHSS